MAIKHGHFDYFYWIPQQVRDAGVVLGFECSLFAMGETEQAVFYIQRTSIASVAGKMRQILKP